MTMRQRSYYNTVIIAIKMVLFLPFLGSSRKILCVTKRDRQLFSENGGLRDEKTLGQANNLEGVDHFNFQKKILGDIIRYYIP